MAISHAECQRRQAVSDAVYAEALRYHEAGLLGEARALYRDILAADPEHPDSLHLLGLITAEQGDPAAGAYR